MTGRPNVASRSSTKQTVVVVDDHPVFREEARTMLEMAGYHVIGEAANAESGIEVALNLRPDIVLLDVQLPDADGFSAAEQIMQSPAAPRIVLISSREAADYGSLLRDSPAVGFVHKPDLCREQLDRLLDGTC